MRAVGITCGIGSMLIGARQAGFDVVGNLEWRKYYFARDQHGRNTFEENFPGAAFKEKVTDLTPQEIERIMNPDLALGHPECGKYSQLSGSVKNRLERAKDPSDIPLFCDLIREIRPRYFVMDDLPRSLEAFPMAEYAKRLPDYDLFPEWVSNWAYGNVQRKRDRMFMLGSLRDEKWAFVPGEVEHDLLVKDVIEDLGEPRRGSNYPNHEPQELDTDCFRALNLGSYRRKASWRDVKEYFSDKKGGHTLAYVRADGSVVNRIGFVRGHWEGPAHVLTGGNASLHYHRCEPYTIRERARIQGFPDDFVFYGTVLNDRGEWDHDKNQHMIRQTGKAMPIQFCRYVSEQIASAIRGNPFDPAQGSRVLRSNEHVDRAKYWYCENRGYADQGRACASCWLYSQCTIRMRKYQIGEPAQGQRDLVDPGVVPLETPRKGHVPKLRLNSGAASVDAKLDTNGAILKRARSSPAAAGSEGSRPNPTSRVGSRRFAEATSVRDLEFGDN